MEQTKELDILDSPHCTGCKWTNKVKPHTCLTCGLTMEELKNSKCENCGVKLFSSFTNGWHNPKFCIIKRHKAFVPRSDCA